MRFSNTEETPLEGHDSSELEIRGRSYFRLSHTDSCSLTGFVILDCRLSRHLSHPEQLLGLNTTGFSIEIYPREFPDRLKRPER